MNRIVPTLIAALCILTGGANYSLAAVEDELRGLTERVEELEKTTDVRIGASTTATRTGAKPPKTRAAISPSTRFA